MGYGKATRFAVGFGFALVATLASSAVYEHRDEVFAWSWARPQGSLHDDIAPALLVSARAVLEAERAGQACVVKPLARDDRYLYLASGCAKFRESGQIAEGDPRMVPTRFRYGGEQASAGERARGPDFENSLRRLFPQRVFERIRYGVPRLEYEKAAQLRMRELSAGAPH